jgi:hypothetical protein
MIRAPDGSFATYDAPRTRAAYADPAMGDYCECLGCRNYRAAWKPQYFEPTLLAACERIGINPSKAFETVEVGSKESGVSYIGELFFGEVDEARYTHTEPYQWRFTQVGPGAGAFAHGLVAISFELELPCILPEPNPYLP